MPNSPLEKRIIELSYKYQLSHIGSCLTALPIIHDIFYLKKKSEKFVLSSGHAAVALYAVIESFGGKSAEDIFLHHGVHPDYCPECGLDCSTGSLGHGLPIAIGMALSDRSKNVYCLCSDGETAEGSIYESVRIIGDENITNLRVFFNLNGWAAYRMVDPSLLSKQLSSMSGYMGNVIFAETWRTVVLPDFLKGQDSHYYKMTKEDYETYIR